MASRSRVFLAFFLTSAAVLTAACGLVYLVTQQGLRSGANDPQIQLAEDAAARLNAGSSPTDVVPAGAVDLAASLAPFVVVDDAAGTVVAANGSLDGRPPSPPAGVLEAAHAAGRDVVTWQPRSGVRIALVVIPWRGGTVLAGRSLRLVEQQENDALLLAAVGWLAGVVAVAVASAVAAWLVAGRRSARR